MRVTVAALVTLALAGCGTTSTPTTTRTATTGSALAAALSTAYSTAPQRRAPTTFEVEREQSACHGSGTLWECSLTIDAVGTNQEPAWVSYFRVQVGGDGCFTATETATRNPNEQHRSPPENPIVANGCLSSA